MKNQKKLIYAVLVGSFLGILLIASPVMAKGGPSDVKNDNAAFAKISSRAVNTHEITIGSLFWNLFMGGDIGIQSTCVESDGNSRKFNPPRGIDGGENGFIMEKERP